MASSDFTYALFFQYLTHLTLRLQPPSVDICPPSGPPMALFPMILPQYVLCCVCVPSWPPNALCLDLHYLTTLCLSVPLADSMSLAWTVCPFVPSYEG